MTEPLRALVVIFALAVITFSFTSKAFANSIDIRALKEWRNTWLVITFAAFLSHSFWLYAPIAIIVLIVASRRTKNPVALYFVCLFAVPAVGVQIPGFGIVNYLFSINHPRLLSLCLLVPAYLSVRSRSDTVSFGKLWPDRFLILLVLLMVVLQLRGTTLTDSLRQTLYLLLDVILPYYVISRFVRDFAAFKAVIAGFLVAALLLAGSAAFESQKHWNLYSAVMYAFDSNIGVGAYLARSGILRASSSTGHSIVLGYILAVAIGFFLFFHTEVRNKLMRRISWVALFVGLIAPLSRGPWVGTVAILAAYIATGHAAIKKLVITVFAGVVALGVLAALPGGDKILGFLPFVGSVEKGNIDYRERLIDNAWIVIQRNPLLGSVDYRNTPEMESMRQGQGIIDIVNTYIGVALEYGLVGLGLFAGFFLTALYGAFKAFRSVRQIDEEMYHLGRSLFATLVGILVIIFTVSSITYIPIVYWAVAALCVAYTQLVRNTLRSQSTEKPAG